MEVPQNKNKNFITKIIDSNFFYFKPHHKIMSKNGFSVTVMLTHSPLQTKRVMLLGEVMRQYGHRISIT